MTITYREHKIKTDFLSEIKENPKEKWKQRSKSTENNNCHRIPIILKSKDMNSNALKKGTQTHLYVHVHTAISTTAKR